MTAAAAACEALLEMEGQMLGNRSSLGERQGPWLTYSLTQSLTESLNHYLSTENAGKGAVCWQFMFQTLQQLVRMALYLGCNGQRAVMCQPKGDH